MINDKVNEAQMEMQKHMDETRTDRQVLVRILAYATANSDCKLVGLVLGL